jgi:O-antigen/teichoic acid export membrane protein
VFAPQLVHIVAGHAYAASVTPLRLLLLSLPLSYVSTFLLYLLIAADRQRQVVPLMVASIALNLALNVALVPFYSYDGPAIATLTTEIAGMVVLLEMVRRMLGIRVLSVSLVRTIAAGAAMLATALLLQPVDAALACVASVAIYAAATLTLRIVRPLDLKLLVGRAT